MLQAHSILWHYLWVAPNVVLFALGWLLWRRGLSGQLRAFVAFALLSAPANLCVYFADVLPWVSPKAFWHTAWGCLLLESLLKFLVISEVFSRILSPYPSISRLGRSLISGFGALLVFVAALVAAFSKGDTPAHLISGLHLLNQTVFIVELGLIVFLFLFAAYFRLSLDRFSFGICLGLGISACGYLASWAVMTNGDLSPYSRTMLDFLNMATYHATVLLWAYYLLVPGKVAVRSAPPLPENNLALWNRELERLLQ